jgi:hypothetical protein
MELFCRGFMIGLNASCNFIVLLVVAPLTLVFAPLVTLVAPVIAVLNFLAVFPLATNPFFEGFLGWFSLAMPMAWPGHLLGLFWYLINAFFALFFPTRFDMDWPTGGFVLEGSITAVLPSALGYNSGCFSFITPRVARRALLPGGFDITSEGTLIHETGHALNNAAFGPWFGLANAVENGIRVALGQSTRRTYGEMIAESHSRSSTAPWVNCWAPYVGPSGATASNAPPAGNVVLPEPLGTVSLPVFQTVFALPSGTTITMDASGVSDPDNYLLGSVSPPAGAPLVLFWDLAPNPIVALSATTVPTVTATTAIGGDAPLLTFRASDGVEGNSLALLIVVVEARPNGPYAGRVNQPVALTATGSTAGSQGGLPSATAAGAPVLTLVWTVTQSVVGSTPVLDDPAAESPTFTADVAGQYQVTLTVTETTGVSHSATAAIDITP